MLLVFSIVYVGRLIRATKVDMQINLIYLGACKIGNLMVGVSLLMLPRDRLIILVLALASRGCAFSRLVLGHWLGLVTSDKLVWQDGPTIVGTGLHRGSILIDCLYEIVAIK